MKKYKVKIKEVIEHTFEVLEFNEFMAKKVAKELLIKQQKERILKDNFDIFIEQIK